MFKKNLIKGLFAVSILVASTGQVFATNGMGSDSTNISIMGSNQPDVEIDTMMTTSTVNLGTLNGLNQSSSSYMGSYDFTFNTGISGGYWGFHNAITIAGSAYAASSVNISFTTDPDVTVCEAGTANNACSQAYGSIDSTYFMGNDFSKNYDIQLYVPAMYNTNASSNITVNVSAM